MAVGIEVSSALLRAFSEGLHDFAGVDALHGSDLLATSHGGGRREGQ